MEKRMKEREEEFKKLIESGADEETKRRFTVHMEKKAKEEKDALNEKIKKMIAEGLRQKALQFEYARVEKQLNEILPLVNEANLAATELERDIKFNTKMVKKLDPFLTNGQMKQGITNVLVKVVNNEENYYYEWDIEKFRNRLFMIRELLEEYFDSGDLPMNEKETDPFWDPPNPIQIGQSFIQLEALGVQIEN